MLLVAVFALGLMGSNCLAAALGDRVLVPGCWGADVFELQMRLHDMGYSVVADGRYGPKTQQAVAAFQRKKGIAADGLAGKETILHLVGRYGIAEHHVKQGDTVSGIAKQYDVRQEDITRFNVISGSLKVGQVLRFPLAPRYQVKSGDTLHSIATQFQTSIQELRTLNHLSENAPLQAGMWLRLPYPDY